MFKRERLEKIEESVIKLEGKILSLKKDIDSKDFIVEEVGKNKTFLDEKINEVSESIEKRVLAETDKISQTQNNITSDLKQELCEAIKKISILEKEIKSKNEAIASQNKVNFEVKDLLTKLQDSVKINSIEIDKRREDNKSLRTDVNKLLEEIKTIVEPVKKEIETVKKSILDDGRKALDYIEQMKKREVGQEKEIISLSKDLSILKDQVSIQIEKKVNQTKDELEKIISIDKKEGEDKIILISKKQSEASSRDITSARNDLGNEIERKFIEFHKYLIQEYFKNLENIFKEIALMEGAVKNPDGQDFKKLKREIIEPYIRKNYELMEKLKGVKVSDNLKSKGEEIIEKRKAIHDKLLNEEKQGRNVDALKGELKAYDYIIGGDNGKK